MGELVAIDGGATTATEAPKVLSERDATAALVRAVRVAIAGHRAVLEGMDAFSGDEAAKGPMLDFLARSYDDAIHSLTAAIEGLDTSTVPVAAEDPSKLKPLCPHCGAELQYGTRQIVSENPDRSRNVFALMFCACCAATLHLQALQLGAPSPIASPGILLPNDRLPPGLRG